MSSEVVMLVLPFPAQGHLNQLLHFCRLVLSSSNNTIPIYFLSSATHNRQAKTRLHGWNTSEYSNLRFHNLHVPSYSTPPPDLSSLENFPAHLQPAFDATQIYLQTQLDKLLRSFSTSYRRVIVVHDSLMSSFSTFEGGGVESYAFHSVSAFANLLFQWESRETISGNRVKSLGLSSVSASSKAVTSSEGCFTTEFLEFIRRQHKLTAVDSGRIINTCLPIEDKFIELFAREPILNRKPLFHIGPLHPLIAPTTEKSSDDHPHECLRWLDKQPQSSVLYVSFGTTTTMSLRQMNELSAGLERSQHSFLWISREADRGDIFTGKGGGTSTTGGIVPKGRGIVVRDWAPQVKILAHAAVGGFMTHCGWNSCIESLSYGVPMVVWPMHSDQPRNSVMVTEILRVGVAVREWSASTSTSVVEGARIESTIRKLMMSAELRRRAQTIGVSVRQAASKDGSSVKQLNSFIKLITRP